MLGVDAARGGNRAVLGVSAAVIRGDRSWQRRIGPRVNIVWLDRMMVLHLRISIGGLYGMRGALLSRA